jgi:hypothetical protein
LYAESLTFQLRPQLYVIIIAQTAFERIRGLEGGNGWEPRLAIQEQQECAELHVAPKCVGGFEHGLHPAREDSMRAISAGVRAKRR